MAAARPARRFLITGGTSGIGAAIATRAAADGHRVLVTARDPERLQAVCDAHPGMEGVAADAAEWSDTRDAVARAAARLGGLDAVVANAGFSARGDLEGGDPEQWRRMVLTNVLGPALLVKAALPLLRESRGHVVLMGSASGRKVYPGNLYTATKWALTGYAESLRQQLVGSGVRMTLVAPGHVRTPLWESAPDAWISPDQVAAAVMWALEQPDDVDVSEVVIRATGQEF